MPTNPFEYSINERIKIVNFLSREIKLKYKKLSEYFAARAEELNKGMYYNSGMSAIELNELKSEIGVKLIRCDRETDDLIRAQAKQMAKTVIKNNQMFLYGIGFDKTSVDEENPQMVNRLVSNIVSGKIYFGTYDLSNSIWRDNINKNKEINLLISMGVAKGDSIYDITRTLVRYLNPDADINKPRIRNRIDYNSQRLAKTIISQTYEEAFVEVTKDNPFVEAYQWETSGSDRVCPVCLDRESMDNYGLGPGVYPKDELPLDHPNGMCTYYPIMAYTESEIRHFVDNWKNGTGDEKMNKSISDFIESL